MIGKRFEYQSLFFEPGGFFGGKLDKNDFDSQLNRLGQDGWELVSCVDTNWGYGTTRLVVAAFKREVPSS